MESVPRTACAPDANGKPRSRTSLNFSPEFSAWWKAYPRKANKWQAWVSFQKALKVASLAELMAGAEGYRQQTLGMEERYICHGATFLHQRRWMDFSEMTTGATSPSRSEWRCAHEPRCPHKNACAVVTSRQCPHTPKCQSRGSCAQQLLEAWG